MRHRTAIYYGLFFASGAAALVLQVLWVRELGLLFGNTAHATATTLTVFFAGFAIGGHIWGRQASQLQRPLRGYAILELGVAATAIVSIALPSLYGVVYPWLYRTLQGAPVALVAAQAVLVSLPLAPATIFMGGTFPLLGQHVIRSRHELGPTGTRLYGVNTAGAATGTLLAGFFLPRIFGVTGSYLLAAGTLVAIALVAHGLSRSAPPPEPREPEPVARPTSAPPRLSLRLVLLLAFSSGVVTIGLEVLWTRMFAQVLQNSVYSFAVVVVVFLLALAIGAGLAHRLTSLPHDPRRILAVLWTLGGAAAVLSPLWFYRLTDGLTYLAPEAGWLPYLTAAFGLALAVTLLPIGLLGSVFPFMLKVQEGRAAGPGNAIGQLIWSNALGGIVGSILAGFVLLDAAGLWTSIALFGYGSLVLAAGLMSVAPGRRWAAQTFPFAVLLVTGFVGRTRAIPTTRLEPGEQIERVWQGAYGTVAALRSGSNLILRLDNSYTLGDTESAAVERMQAHIPLLLHPRPDSVFFLGLGTGFTAAAALDHPTKHVVAAELVPAVVDAARQVFRPYLGTFFDDPRVRILEADGRNVLMGTPDRFDVIVSDLFTPWHAGTGSLYTQEHFQRARERLRPGGLFAQWLPLYQLSEREVLIIAQTMRSVFPRVTVWRGNFSPSRPVVALIGQRDAQALEFDVLSRNAARLFGIDSDPDPGSTLLDLFYAGNARRFENAFGPVPLNTDRRPVIEYLAPIAQREAASGARQRLIGAALERLLDPLQPVPGDGDSSWSVAISPAGTGQKLFRMYLYRESGNPRAAEELYAELQPQIRGTLAASIIDTAWVEGAR